MIKSKSNMFLIGIAVAYMVLFIGQFFSPNLFSVRLYNTVAWVSLSLSITELLKSCLLKFNESLLMQKLYLQTLFDIVDQRCRESLYANSSDEKIRQKNQESIEKVGVKSEKNNRTVKIGNVSVSIGYIFAMVILIVTPFIDVPDNLHTQKIISLLTLFTFSLLFISIALDELFSHQHSEYAEKFKYFVEIENLRSENLKLRSEQDIPPLTSTDKDCK